MFATTPSAVSTLPNTPNMGPMVAPPTLFTFGTAQPVYPIGMTATPMVPIQTVYNAQPYLTETNKRTLHFTTESVRSNHINRIHENKYKK